MISINGLLNRFRRHQDGSSSQARWRIFPTESTVDVCECLYLFMRSNVRCSYGSSLGAIEAIVVAVERAESILPFPSSPFAFCLIKCALINQSKRASSEPLVERAIINIAGKLAQWRRQWRWTVPYRSQCIDPIGFVILLPCWSHLHLACDILLAVRFVYCAPASCIIYLAAPSLA